MRRRAPGTGQVDHPVVVSPIPAPCAHEFTAPLSVRPQALATVESKARAPSATG